MQYDKSDNKASYQTLATTNSNSSQKQSSPVRKIYKTEVTIQLEPTDTSNKVNSNQVNGNRLELESKKKMEHPSPGDSDNKQLVSNNRQLANRESVRKKKSVEFAAAPANKSYFRRSKSFNVRSSRDRAAADREHLIKTDAKLARKLQYKYAKEDYDAEKYRERLNNKMTKTLGDAFFPQKCKNSTFFVPSVANGSTNHDHNNQHNASERLNNIINSSPTFEELKKWNELIDTKFDTLTRQKKLCSDEVRKFHKRESVPPSRPQPASPKYVIASSIFPSKAKFKSERCVIQ